MHKMAAINTSITQVKEDGLSMLIMPISINTHKIITTRAAESIKPIGPNERIDARI
jgi:hypothetical protein